MSANTPPRTTPPRGEVGEPAIPPREALGLKTSEPTLPSAGPANSG